MPEEKRTDVNIALRMVQDAYENQCDRFVIVTGDSDLVPVIDVIKTKYPQKKVIVYVPARNRTRGAATEIRFAADKHKTLPLDLLKYSQFPPQVADGSGGFILKPSSW